MPALVDFTQKHNDFGTADLRVKKRGLYSHREYLHFLKLGRNPNEYLNLKVFRNYQKWVPLES